MFLLNTVICLFITQLTVKINCEKKYVSSLTLQYVFYISFWIIKEKRTETILFKKHESRNSRFLVLFSQATPTTRDTLLVYLFYLSIINIINNLHPDHLAMLLVLVVEAVFERAVGGPRRQVAHADPKRTPVRYRRPLFIHQTLYRTPNMFYNLFLKIQLFHLQKSL